MASTRSRSMSENRSPRYSWISPKAGVRESPVHGRGLFATAPIQEGEVVAIKGGYVFDRAALPEIETRLGPAEIQVADGLFIGPVRDAEREGGMIFSNHSCAPNIGVKGQVVFVAMRDIDAGEELTHDWAMTDDDTYEMECNCGAPDCRGVITGRDWQRSELQERYRGYMSWYLEEKIRQVEQC